MTLKAPGRLKLILDEMHKVDDLCCIGTRLPQGAQPIEQQELNGYMCYHAGYARRSNSHAGITMCFKLQTTSVSAIHSFAFPQAPELQGRGLAVRVRGQLHDVLHIAIYPPPYGTNKGVSITQRLVYWVQQLLEAMPCRTIPIVYMDANAQVGLCCTAFGEQKIYSESIGMHCRGKEHEQS
eukprot:4063465-Karenia_brevis.AAC.1